MSFHQPIRMQVPPLGKAGRTMAPLWGSWDALELCTDLVILLFSHCRIGRQQVDYFACVSSPNMMNIPQYAGTVASKMSQLRK